MRVCCFLFKVFRYCCCKYEEDYLIRFGLFWTVGDGACKQKPCYFSTIKEEGHYDMVAHRASLCDVLAMDMFTSPFRKGYDLGSIAGTLLGNLL